MPDTGGKSVRRGQATPGSHDALQMPNRPLRRGENLLEIWDRSLAKQEKSSDRTKKGKATPVDMAALIGPQKLSQWCSQIGQADSFCDYLEGKAAYLDELNQGKCSLHTSSYIDESSRIIS